jgi:glycosyltransferase involved in cell wall biosynthesis
LINDGSYDSSVNRIPISKNIILIQQSRNMGKGRALRTGIEKSIELNSEITITLDADNQHDPELIPKFVDKIRFYDIVIGSRRRDQTAMPWHRRLSNYLTSKLLSIKTGEKIIDSQSGYRAFKTEICKDILPDFGGFEAESEMLVKASRNKLKIGFLEIPTIYGDDESKMKVLPTIIGFIKVLLKS